MHYKPIIPALQRLRQEDHEFDVSLGKALSQKTKIIKKQKQD
jgi:hypothetical protein